MVRRTLVATIVLAFIILPTAGVSYAQEMPFIVSGGISKMVGEGSEYWNTGFSVGGSRFYPVSSIFYLGGRFAYNRWTPNEKELTKEFAGYGIDWDISGSATIYEVVPSIRISEPMANTQSGNFFVQLGLGYFLVSLNAIVRGYYMGRSVEASIEDSGDKFGLNLGGGFFVGKIGSIRFEVLPLYYIIFTEDETSKYFKYFSVSVNAVF